MRKILIALVLLFGFQASARHLISGNFTYEFVSQSENQRTFKINLYLFRDMTGVNLPSTAKNPGSSRADWIKVQSVKLA